MSRPTPQDIPCPKCQKLSPFTKWDSLNVTLDPDKKQPLLEGKLTLFTCPACGHSAQVIYPLLYHDMPGAFMIWLIPNTPDGQPGKPPQELPPDMLKKFGDKYRFRSVEDRNQLVEKIYVFDARLDDRVVEIAKLIAAAKLPPDKQNPATRIYFSGVSGEGEAATMNFAVLTAAGTSGLTVARDKIYNMIVKECAHALQRSVPGSWPRVDAKFAQEILNTPKTPAPQSSPPNPVSPPPPAQRVSTPPPQPPAQSAAPPPVPEPTPPKKKWWKFGK